MTTKGKYAVSIMCELSSAYIGAKALQSKDIARTQFIPQMYVEQLLNKLKKAKLVKAIRGPGGGYFLTRPPKSIKIGEIIEATEGPISLASCVTKGASPACAMAPKCKTKKFWTDLSQVIENMLDKTTLADLC